MKLSWNTATERAARVKRLLNTNLKSRVRFRVCYNKGAMASLNKGSRRLITKK